MTAEKPPIKRNLALMIGSLVIAGLFLGLIIGWVFGGAPGEETAEEIAAAEQAAIEALPPAELGEIDRRLAEARAENDRMREALRRAEIESAGQAGRQPLGAGEPTMPAVDPDLLAALAEADAAVGAAPRLTGGTDRQINQPGGGAGAGDIAGVFGGGSGGAAGGWPAAMFEAYAEGEANVDGAPEPEEPFAVIRPASPPSDRVISQGAMLRGILVTRIDTRNPGDVVAQITSDVYDTATASILLVPRGSRLLGSYATQVSPGNPRIAIAFRRLMLPDGRAIELPDMAAVGQDGVTGVEGRYRSNLLRAIGPSIMVTLVGAWADEQTRPETPTAGTQSPMVQSPSVVQQVVPQINEAILRRYEGAAPFFTAQPGATLKVMVNADIEIPLVENRS